MWDFNHVVDENVLKAWARHFRNHYCLDIQIDVLRDGTGLSRSQYLLDLKFPDQVSGFGPGIRAGDFGEVLVADYLEYILGYWVPRTRYSDKAIRNESTKGCDLIGFYALDHNKPSPQDLLTMFECKAQFSGSTPGPRLQDAIDGSAKDEIRKAESLNAIKQRLVDQNDAVGAAYVGRFQNPTDNPYHQSHGAVALFDNSLHSSGLQDLVKLTDASNHPAATSMSLMIIKGNDMMRLTHDLYARAASEA